MILVTGATGTNGRVAVQLLLRAGAAVRAMVQNTAGAADLAQTGSEKENPMTSTPDKAEIDALFRQLARAHADHDADAIIDSYAPDAVIFDLAPPLARRGMKRDSVAAWLGSWEGPIQIDPHDVNLVVDGGLAFVSALTRMRGRQDGEEQDFWYRTTMCLRKTSGRWRIVCDHSSVPFYMDGSYRAAVDLKP